MLIIYSNEAYFFNTVPEHTDASVQFWQILQCEEVEIAIHEWLKLQNPDFYSDKTCAMTRQMH
jgi:hypothetical protein